MVIDASVWIGALHVQDAHHAASTRWLNQHLTGATQLVTPTLALAEVAGAIRRRTGSVASGNRVIADIAALPGLDLVPLDIALASEAAALAADRALRGADAVYVAVARRLGLPLVTWDEEIHTRCAGVIRVVYP